MRRPRVMEAMKYAGEVHEGHMDDLNTSYFASHILHVFGILEVALDHENSMFKGTDYDNLLIAALLHDAVEDRDVAIETIDEKFGSDVATIVHAVTHTGIKDEFGYYFPRLLVGKRYNILIHMAVVLKFADRMSNIIRGGGWSISRLVKYLKRSIFWKTKKMKGNPLQDS